MKKILILTMSLIVSLTACKKETSTTNPENNVNSEDINFNYSGTAIGKFGDDVTDVEGNKYKTVFIGKQQWFAENLKVTKYNDKTPIKNIERNFSDYVKDSMWRKNIDPAWCYLDNMPKNKYLGLLYNFYVIDNGLQKNACPEGWRIPNNDDWNELINFLGGKEVAGDKLKEMGDKHWASGNLGTNTSLFTAFPVGNKYDGSWWSSSDGYNDSFYDYKSYLVIDHTKHGVSLGNDASKYDAYTIRCVKD
jgi:uncharacterized protein (TIGR02145 family)